jgi:ribosomal protein S18 acetylase RimI-like enzyme
MVKTTPVTSQRDIDALAELAREIWNEHFPPIIGQAQVDYMLEKFQSAPAIARQIHEAGYAYYVVVEEREQVGYFALVPNVERASMQLSKIYMKREYRGRGLGRAVLSFVEDECAALGLSELWLTVNKDNLDSIAFYERQGFVVDGPLNTDIGGGFVMDDHRMVKHLTIAV